MCTYTVAIKMILIQIILRKVHIRTSKKPTKSAHSCHYVPDAELCTIFEF